MAKTPSLFDEPPEDDGDDENPLSHHNAPETSGEAGCAKRPSAATQRGHVYDRLLGSGKHGATNDELEDSLGLDGNSIRPRMIELRGLNRGTNLPCLVADSGERRKTRAGKSAVVWVALACLEEVADAR